MGETPFACAERETLEEAGVHVKAEKLIGLTNDIFDPQSKHYITLFVACRLVDESQQPKASVYTSFSNLSCSAHPHFLCKATLPN